MSNIFPCHNCLCLPICRSITKEIISEYSKVPDVDMQLALVETLVLRCRLIYEYITTVKEEADRVKTISLNWLRRKELLEYFLGETNGNSL